MNKKIRYAMGAVGAMPALAMIPAQFAAPAAHAGKTAATTGKKVRTVYARDTAFAAGTSSPSPNISPNVGSCRGNTGHHNKHSDVTVRFYTRAIISQNRTCIGTIKVSDSSPFTSRVGGFVSNSGVGAGCFFSAGHLVVSHRCRRVFRNDNGFDAPHPLTVRGFGALGDFQSNVASTINSRGQFRNDGF